MKKYLLPTLTVIGVALGIVVGMAISQKANAQRISYQNGQWKIEESKVDRLLQLMQEAYVDTLNMDSITDEVMSDLVQKLDLVSISQQLIYQLNLVMLINLIRIIKNYFDMTKLKIMRFMQNLIQQQERTT